MQEDAEKRGVMTFTDASGVYGNAEPSNVGLVVTSPDRRELLNVNWATLRGIGNFKYCVAGAAPAGCAIFNYAQEEIPIHLPATSCRAGIPLIVFKDCFSDIIEIRGRMGERLGLGEAADSIPARSMLFF